MKKKTLRKDIEFLSDALDSYIEELENDAVEISALQNTIDKVCAENAKLNEHIKTLEKQLLQSDYYINRKDEENNLLKRMYRDDLINGVVR